MPPVPLAGCGRQPVYRDPLVGDAHDKDTALRAARRRGRGGRGLDLACTLGEVGIVAALGSLAMKDLPTEGRIQVVVVAAASSLLFWHLLHLLAGFSSH